MIRIFAITLFIIVSLAIFTTLTGCSPQPAMGPKETVDAFFKAIIAGDTEGAMEYVEGVDTTAIERLGLIRERGKEVLDKFFSSSTSTLLEQEGKTAKVQWEMDLEGMTGRKAAEENEPEKRGAGEIIKKLVEDKLEELTTTIFTLEIRGGKWKIIKIEHPKSEGLLRRRGE